MDIYSFDEICDRLVELSLCVPQNDYPQSYEILDNIDQDYYFAKFGDELYSPLFFADFFLKSDKGKPMHPDIAKFVLDTYVTASGSHLKDLASEASCKMGDIYYTGRLGETDVKKAVEYYMIAVHAGNNAAAQKLGLCYFYGNGVEKDYEKAFNYFALGAFEGDCVSLYKIGDMYRYGYFVEKNESEAFKIYNHCFKLFSQDDTSKPCGADICLRLGDCFAEGIGTQTRFAEALRLYQCGVGLYMTRIMDGDKGCREEYNLCVEKENKVREILEYNFPEE